MHQAGLLDYAVRNAKNAKNIPCFIHKKEKNTGEADPIELEDFFPAFIIMGIGFAIAFFILILEVIVKKMKVIVKKIPPLRSH